MQPQRCFKYNTPVVISEIVGSEVIIINLESGVYYSLRDAGAAIWHLIGQGATFSQIVDLLARSYEGNQPAIASSVQELLDELELERLISPIKADGAGILNPPNLPEFLNGNKPPFQIPILEKYTDMEELLLLDPIHEVDESGWPNPKNAR